MRFSRLILFGVIVCALASSCTDGGRGPSGPSAVPHATPTQIAATVSWQCSAGRVLSGGDGWQFTPAAECGSAASLAQTSSVASGLVTLAPTNLRATVSSSTVVLEWAMAPDGVTNFRIEAGSASTLADLATLLTPSAATILTVTNVPNGSYYVRVRGVGADGVPGPASNEIVVRVGTAPPGVPEAPTQLAAQVVGNQVTLTWTAPAGAAASSYLIEAGSATGGSDIVVFDTGNPATALVALAPNGIYYVRIRGRNPLGSGTASNEVAVYVGVPIPTEVCGDGVDNDRDGQTDEDCSEVCGDGVDNDRDGAVDEGCAPPGGGGGGGGGGGTDPPSCTFAVSRTSVEIGFAGGTFDVTVTTNVASCQWSASGSDFVSIASAGPPAGTGTVRFQVGANGVAKPRSATVRVAGQNVSVSQEGNSIDERIDPPTVTVPPGSNVTPPTIEPRNDRPDAGTGPPVTATAAPVPSGIPTPTGTTLRSYAVASDQEFNRLIVSVDVPQATAVGPLTVTSNYYNIDFGTSRLKVAQVTIPVETTAVSFRVDFAGAVGNTVGRYFAVVVEPTPPTIPACTFSLSPLTADVPAGGGTFDVAVTTTHAGCIWSTPNPQPSTFISSTSSGSGSGTARFTVTANTTGSGRKGSARISWIANAQGTGQEIMVSQAAPVPQCTYTMSPPALRLTSEGIGLDPIFPSTPEDWSPPTVDVEVTTQGPAGCTWALDTAGSTFVTWASGATKGSGPGTVRMTFKVHSNRTTVDRDVRVRISTSGGATPTQDLTFRQAHPRALIAVRWLTGPGGVPHPRSDIDLMLFDPNGTLVHHHRKRVESAYLEDDNKPLQSAPDPPGTVEKIYIDEPLAGTYQVFLVHTGGGNQDTTSEVTIVVGLDSGPQQFRYSRFTNDDIDNEDTQIIGHNVADVNVAARTVVEKTGTRVLPRPLP